MQGFEKLLDITNSLTRRKSFHIKLITELQRVIIVAVITDSFCNAVNNLGAIYLGNLN